MKAPKESKIKNLFSSLMSKGVKPGEEAKNSGLLSKENVLVFGGAYLVSLVLWFVVNLNGVFNVNLQVPIQLSSLPADKALSSNLPKFVSVDLTGEALELIRIYNNPPVIDINVEDRNVNLFNQIRQQFNTVQNVEVIKVEPISLVVSLEDKVSKKIPVIVPTNLKFQNRYGLISEPSLSPDSITISGAVSEVSKVDSWVLKDTLILTDIRNDIRVNLTLENENQLISLSNSSVNYSADVSEFTEGEINVYIRTRGLPRGENITYNPSSINIKYDVPIELYSSLQSQRIYEAYVDYSEIRDDFTGFVSPNIELLTTQYNIRLRNFQPKAVAYFSVVEQ